MRLPLDLNFNLFAGFGVYAVSKSFVVPDGSSLIDYSFFAYNQSCKINPIGNAFSSVVGIANIHSAKYQIYSPVY